MHRLTRAAALIAVMVGAPAVLLAPGVALGRAPQRISPPSGISSAADAVALARHDPTAIRNGTTNEECTGWRNTFVPPRTIRVLRSTGPNKGYVDVVPFRQYVLTVVPREWGSANAPPIEQIGALAVKQYAWYYTIVYRGGSVPGRTKGTTECYDVVDTTQDQLYDPDSKPKPNITPAVINAVDRTWRTSLRKYHESDDSSTMMLTGYNSCSPGGCVKHAACGSDADGSHLWQATLYRCVNDDGLDFEQTLRKYLDPRLEIVTPGTHNVIGTPRGDGAVLTPDNGGLTPRLYVGAPGAVRATNDSAAWLPTNGLLGKASADITGDGFDDLVTLSSPGGNTARVTVAPSNRTGGYARSTTWWTGSIGVPAANAQLFVVDFTGDGRPDVGMLVDVPGTGETSPRRVELLVLATRGDRSAPQQPTLWWTGPIDRTRPVRVFAADVNGDGAADLLEMRAVSFADSGPGTRIQVATSTPPAPGLGKFTVWYDLPDVQVTTSLATTGDFNRDGKEDLVVAYPGGDGLTHVDAVRRWRAHVERVALWTAKGLPISHLKLATADVNLDGISDLVVYQAMPNGAGTRVRVEIGNYARLTNFTSMVDAALTWSTARPY